MSAVHREWVEGQADAAQAEELRQLREALSAETTARAAELDGALSVIANDMAQLVLAHLRRDADAVYHTLEKITREKVQIMAKTGRTLQ